MAAFPPREVKITVTGIDPDELANNDTARQLVTAMQEHLAWRTVAIEERHSVTYEDHAEVTMLPPTNADLRNGTRTMHAVMRLRQ